MNALGVPVLSSLLFATSVGAAPPPSLESEATPAPPGSESGLRVGLDYGLSAGVAPAVSSYSGTPVVGVSFAFDLGYQFDRNHALLLRTDVGSVLVSSYAGAYLMVENTPVRQFSVAAGAGAEAGMTFLLSDYAGLAFPLRLSWNFLSEESWSARKGNNTWRLSLQFVGGLRMNAPESGGGFYRGAITFGYAWM
ncbi:MAG: hypothetical protein AAFU79_11810 [Myxococcota bacterium]